MNFFRSLLAVTMLALVVRCGGAVDGDDVPHHVDAGLDGSSDAGSADHATLPPDGSDAETIDGGDAQVEAGSDAATCSLPDGSNYECDPLAQCACGFGMACDLLKLELSSHGQEGSVCRPAGIAKPYSHCAQDEDCRPGFTCVAEVCRRICAADSECEGVDPYRKCAHLKTVWETKLSYGFCVAVCDPMAPSDDHNDPTFVPCGPGLQCQPKLPQSVEGAVGLTWCTNWSDKPRLGWGKPCKLTAECMPGFVCEPPPVDGGLGELGERVCRKWCEVGSVCSSASGTWPCTPVGFSAGPIQLGLCPV